MRHALWHLGFRYKLNDKKLPGKPDIVLPRYRTVVFVHGCFWHGHQGCKYYTIPKTNIDFWKSKVARNQERDQEQWRGLEAKGWSVIVVWECQLRKDVLDETVDSVAGEIRRNGDLYVRLQNERRASREVYRQEREARKKREEALLSSIKR